MCMRTQTSGQPGNETNLLILVAFLLQLLLALRHLGLGENQTHELRAQLKSEVLRDPCSLGVVSTHSHTHTHTNTHTVNARLGL